MGKLESEVARQEQDVTIHHPQLNYQKFSVGDIQYGYIYGRSRAELRVIPALVKNYELISTEPEEGASRVTVKADIFYDTYRDKKDTKALIGDSFNLLSFQLPSGVLVALVNLCDGISHADRNRWESVYRKLQSAPYKLNALLPDALSTAVAYNDFLMKPDGISYLISESFYQPDNQALLSWINGFSGIDFRSLSIDKTTPAPYSSELARILREKLIDLRRLRAQHQQKFTHILSDEYPDWDPMWGDGIDSLQLLVHDPNTVAYPEYQLSGQMTAVAASRGLADTICGWRISGGAANRTQGLLATDADEVLLAADVNKWVDMAKKALIQTLGEAEGRKLFQQMIHSHKPGNIYASTGVPYDTGNPNQPPSFEEMTAFLQEGGFQVVHKVGSGVSEVELIALTDGAYDPRTHSSQTNAEQKQRVTNAITLFQEDPVEFARNAVVFPSGDDTTAMNVRVTVE